jgi:hypothetical protein
LNDRASVARRQEKPGHLCAQRGRQTDADHCRQRRRDPLSRDEGHAWRRVHQERLERPALPLAGRRIGGDLHAAHKASHHDEHRDEGENLCGPLLRGGDLDFLDRERSDGCGTHAAHDQAEAADLGPVLLQQTVHAIDGRARVVSRTV